jgi:hypothetical protein
MGMTQDDDASGLEALQLEEEDERQNDTPRASPAPSRTSQRASVERVEDLLDTGASSSQQDSPAGRKTPRQSSPPSGSFRKLLSQARDLSSEPRKPRDHQGRLNLELNVRPAVPKKSRGGRSGGANNRTSRPGTQANDRLSTIMKPKGQHRARSNGSGSDMDME